MFEIWEKMRKYEKKRSANLNGLFEKIMKSAYMVVPQAIDPNRAAAQKRS